MSNVTPVVFYGYELSPFAVKIDHVLKLKNIPHHRVNVLSVLPRPELSELLGVSYRRIPVVAIGNDVYCDTGLISNALERRFPSSAGYGTIFPPRKGGKADTGMIKAFAQSYPEKTLFPLAVALLPWQKFPESFVKDRSELGGAPIDANVMVARRPYVISTLSSNLALLEEQLSDDREWLFDTELPSLADVSVYFVYEWLRWNKELLDAQKFPKAIQWMSQMGALLKQKKDAGSGQASKISGDEAAKLICSSSHESYDVVGFDVVEAKRLGAQLGAVVAIAPEDSGRTHPTIGKLVGLSRQEFVLETTGSIGSVVRCHFPRIGYLFKAAGAKL